MWKFLGLKSSDFLSHNVMNFQVLLHLFSVTHRHCVSSGYLLKK